MDLKKLLQKIKGVVDLLICQLNTDCKKKTGALALAKPGLIEGC